MKKIFTYAAMLLYVSAAAQTETEIRSHYTDINKQIRESDENGFEGSLYKNQWVNNSNGKSWPAVGNYSETTNFWYDDSPDHLSASDRNPKNVLVKVEINRKASHLMSSEEYLFKNGRLLFYYNHEGEEGQEWETRIYYNAKGVMFKSSVKANGKELSAKDLLSEEHKDLKPNALKIMNNARKYQDLFVKSML
jgi:hypothetical protein